MAGRRAKKKSGRTRAPRNSHFGLKRFFLIFSLIICIIAVIGVGVLIGMYTSAVAEIKSMNVRNLALNYSSVIYYLDEDGNAVPMEEVFNDGNRIWLNSNEIPTVMKDAIVAIEDERFYDHNGLDMKRTTGAFFGWLKAKATGGTTSYGGSTITQQVIKNITNQKQKTAARKVKEMLLAIALEKELSKDEILTIYLNIIYLSNNCYGVESASNMYYSKPAAELTLNEAAVIAGITQRPEYYNPIRNPKNCKYKDRPFGYGLYHNDRSYMVRVGRFGKLRSRSRRAGIEQQSTGLLHFNVRISHNGKEKQRRRMPSLFICVRLCSFLFLQGFTGLGFFISVKR